MGFSSLDPEKYGSGMPLDVSNMEHLWKGKGKANGFLMRSVDGRIPALQLPIGRMYVGTTNVLSDDGVIPWGNALWRNNGTIDVSPGWRRASLSAYSSSIKAGRRETRYSRGGCRPIQKARLSVKGWSATRLRWQVKQRFPNTSIF